MDTTDMDTVFWYLNDYNGPILPAHRKLSGISMDELPGELSGMRDRDRIMLSVTAKNMKDAVDCTASSIDSAPAVSATKRDARQMHKTCPCLSRLLTAKTYIPYEAYGKGIADTVRDMLDEIQGAGHGKGCSSCAKGRIISKYRARLYSLLKEGKYC